MKYSLDGWQAQIVEQDVQDYQWRGKKFAAYFMATGTGKTIVTTAACSGIAQIREKGMGKAVTVWVITMATLKQQWLEEIPRVDVRGLSALDTLVIDGTAQERLAQLMVVGVMKPKWVVMNYDQLRLHARDLLETIDRENDIIVLDEADSIQNSESDRSMVARSLVCHYRVAATATPVKNMVNSLYPILQFLDPGPRRPHTKGLNGVEVNLPLPDGSPYWGSQAGFERTFCSFNDYGRISGSQNLPLLHRKLEAFGVHVVEKREVLDLPELRTKVVQVDLSPEGRTVYEMARQGFIEWLETEGADKWWSSRYNPQARGKVIQSILAMLTYMRRATSMSPHHFVELMRRKVAEGEGLDTVAWGKIPEDVLTRDNAKFDWITNYLHENMDRADVKGGVILYSQWKDVLAEFQAGVNGLGQTLGMGVYDGDVPQAKREEIRRRVLEGKCKMVLTTNAGGRGLNLQRLNVAIINDLPWTPTEVHQLAGRIERRGQENEMQVYYLVARDTVDSRKMWPTLQQKQKDADQILHGQRGRKVKGVLDGLSDISDVAGWV